MKKSTLFHSAAAAAFAAFLLLPGCGTGGDAPEYPLNNTSWVLALYTLPEPPDPASRPLRPITLLINEENRTSGNAGVNRYTGTATIDLDAGKVQFGPQATTRMAGPGLKSERTYLDALAAARSFRIDGRILTLFGEDGTPLAKFIAHTPDAPRNPVSSQK